MPDYPSSNNTVQVPAKGLLTLKPDQRMELNRLLTEQMSDQNHRSALLFEAFANEPNLMRLIGLEGAGATFVPNLLATLERFGDVDTGELALVRLLQTIRNYVGRTNRIVIDSLITTMDGKTESSNSDVNDPLQHAKQANLDGRYHDTIAFCNRVIQLDPNNALAYHRRGYANASLKQEDQALADYNTAIRLDPTDAFSYNNRGIIYEYRAQYDLALSDYDAAIRINPNLPFAYNCRGRLHQKCERYEKALADFDTVVRLEPQNPAAYDNRAHVFSNLGNSERAMDDLNTAVQIDPQYAEAYRLRGAINHDNKNFALALSDYNTALRLNPRDSTILFARGCAHSDLNQYTQAVADWEEYLRLYPDAEDAEEVRQKVAELRTRYPNRTLTA